MRIIMPEIISLIQHHNLLETEPEKFRPEQCPACGKSGLWCHGHYARKADYEHVGSQSLNPIAIARFYCPYCCKTCSVLPECIPPQRHYPWLIQQAVLLLVFAGVSYRSCSQQTKPSRWTIGRWFRRLGAQFINHCAHLRSLLPSLGRLTELIEFWRILLKGYPLSRVMLNLNNAGVIIP